jgi:hypothetical protein
VKEQCGCPCNVKCNCESEVAEYFRNMEEFEAESPDGRAREERVDEESRWHSVWCDAQDGDGSCNCEGVNKISVEWGEPTVWNRSGVLTVEEEDERALIEYLSIVD